MYLAVRCWRALLALPASVAAEPEQPEGWTTAAPREEIRPRFAYEPRGGRDDKGAFIIRHDRREGLDGWWTHAFPVRGGRFYRFHAVRKVDHVEVGCRSAVVANLLARLIRASRLSATHR